jgi:hypothetical protein
MHRQTFPRNLDQSGSFASGIAAAQDKMITEVSLSFRSHVSAWPLGLYVSLVPICGRCVREPRRRSRGADRPAIEDKGCVEELESRKPTLPYSESIEGGVHDLVHQCREFQPPKVDRVRQDLVEMASTVGIVLVICATAAAQIGLNAWNRPFYEALVASCGKDEGRNGRSRARRFPRPHPHQAGLQRSPRERPEAAP